MKCTNEKWKLKKILSWRFEGKKMENQAANLPWMNDMVGHLFQNYDTIYVQFFPHVYLQSFLLHNLRTFYSQVYDHFLTNVHIYAHKKFHIYALQTSMWYMGLQKVVV